MTVTAGDMEWLKSVAAAASSSSAAPPAVHLPQPVPSDVDEQQRHVQQMLLAMHSVPPAAATSHWPAPPVGIASHVPGMPRNAPVHPGIPHVNHVGAQSSDSAVDHSVSVCFVCARNFYCRYHNAAVCSNLHWRPNASYKVAVINNNNNNKLIYKAP